MGQTRFNSLSVLTIYQDLTSNCDSFNSKVMEICINGKVRKSLSSLKVKNSFLKLI